MKIYLDHSATTPVEAAVLKAMMPYFKQRFGNASSIHQLGQDARHAIDEARTTMAQLINSDPSEIIFTSGGSEADNLAIKGIVEGILLANPNLIPHVITSKIEHKAVFETVKKMEKEGRINVSYLKVNQNGEIYLNDLRKAIQKNTVLVSIMYVNNETGVIQPIREVGKIIERINRERERKGDPSKIYFHTDAVQAAMFLDLNVKYLHVDAMTLSAHKIYGPKGIGFLYLKKGTPISSQILGGEQENGKRAGTENVASIVGFAKALSLAAKNVPKEAKRVEKLRDDFESKIKHEISGIIVNGEKARRVPHIANLSFKGAEGESILLSLDLAGIAASSGSACTSGSLEPSHVLLAMGISPLLAQSSVRFSLGQENSKKDLDTVIIKLKKIIKRLRGISAISN